MNNKLINSKKTSYYIFNRKKLRWNLLDFRSESDPDPFAEVDPLIWIHIKMKRIRNTAINE